MTLPPLWSPDVETEVRRQAYNADTRHQPEEVRFCARCVLSNQRPYVTMDEHGICSACRYKEWYDALDWTARGEKLRALLADVNHQGRWEWGTGHWWDCIVPCSGGKDSSTVADVLRTEYGRHPLCLTWAPFAYTDIGRQNYDAFNHAGFDGLVAYPNGLVHRKLARIALELYGDAWMPFAYGQTNLALHFALRFGIKLIFLGENGEASYGGPEDANDAAQFAWRDWQRVYHKGAAVRSLVTFGRVAGALSRREEDELNLFYSMPDPKLLEERGVECHWLGHYRKWTPQWNYYHAVEHTGFSANPERSEGTYSKYASLDDKLDGFHYYLGFIKFGIGRCTSDAAHEIRDGHITREEGVALVHRYDGEFPSRYYPEFLDYLGLNDEHFWDVVDRYRKPHLWERIEPIAHEFTDEQYAGFEPMDGRPTHGRARRWALKASVS